ncbi:MAG: TetR/AcrR family transcriptional regulator [Sulfitobacter sp.]
MTSPLRQKRRLETAREIQKATLELAMKDRLEDITTEEIALAAGVSTRTFFNYYPNKEAAAIGLPPPFSQEDKEALQHGSGALSADIKQFLDKHMEVLARDEAILRIVGSILRSNEKARGILAGFLAGERESLTDALSYRVEDPQSAATLASHATDAIGRAIHLWEQEENLPLAAALDIVWQGLIDASRLLLLPAD